MPTHKPMEDLAFTQHSRTGAPALVDTVHAQILQAAGQYDEALAELDPKFEDKYCCTVSPALLGAVFASAMVGAPAHSWNVAIAVFALVLVLGIVIGCLCVCNESKKTLMTSLIRHRYLVRSEATPELERRARVKRILDTPHMAAHFDRFLFLPDFVAPLVATIERCYETLVATSAAFRDASDAEKQRVLALAAVNVALETRRN